MCTAMRVAVWRPIVTDRIAKRRLKASSLLTDEDVWVRWSEEIEVRAADPGYMRCTTSTHPKICDDR